MIQIISLLYQFGIAQKFKVSVKWMMEIFTDDSMKVEFSSKIIEEQKIILEKNAQLNK